MSRAAALFLAILLSIAVGVGLLAATSSGNPGEDDDITAAKAMAADAAESARSLERRVDVLAALVDEASDDRARVAKRFDRLAESLRTSIRSLRQAMGEVDSAVADAGARAEHAATEASDAAAKVERIARDIALLESRVDYHLRRSH